MLCVSGWAPLLKIARRLNRAFSAIHGYSRHPAGELGSGLEDQGVVSVGFLTSRAKVRGHVETKED